MIIIMKSKISSSLQSMTIFALALPGLQRPIYADSVPYAKTGIDLKYTHYQESKDRFKIDVAQADFKIPINEKFDVGLYLVQDSMAGASPVFYMPLAIRNMGASLNTLSEVKSGASNIKTGASIRDRRDEMRVVGRYFSGDYVTALSAGYSGENDYHSLTLSGNLQYTFNKKNTALLLGGSYSDDKSKRSPAQGGLPWDSPQSKGHKNTARLTIGVKQDVSKETMMQVNLEADFDQGYLSDPYKRVLIHGDATGARTDSIYTLYANYGLPNPGGYTVDFDRRPRTRKTYALVGQFVHGIEPLKSSLHGNYRFAINDWGVQSHTFEASYFQPIAEGWDVSFLGRYYAQSEARFYDMAFSVMPNSPFPAKSIGLSDLASSDYRLTYFGSFGGEIKVIKEITPQISANILAGLSVRNGQFSFLGKSKINNPSNTFNTYYI
ncbi:MAG: DUF3570 domain-containing protein, partial [Caedimonadaceae bacterium]